LQRTNKSLDLRSLSRHPPEHGQKTPGTGSSRAGRPNAAPILRAKEAADKSSPSETKNVLPTAIGDSTQRLMKSVRLARETIDRRLSSAPRGNGHPRAIAVINRKKLPFTPGP